jgi:hypothetical protein
MNSEKEIRDLMNKYCYFVDSADFESSAQLLEHAEWIAGGKIPDETALARNLILYSDGTPKTKHTISNISIEIDEAADYASAHSYVTVFQQTDDFPLQAIVCGDYYDEFARVGGIWRFTKREFKNYIVGDMTAHLRNPSEVIPGA